MKKLLILFILLVSLSIVNATMEDYPEPYVKDHYTDDLYAVLGRAHATTHSIASTNVILGVGPVNGNFNTRFEDEITSLNHNFIAIGNPCENTLTKRLLNTANCDLGLTIGEGAIKHVTNNGYNSIIVIGTDRESLIRASLVLKNYGNYDLDGDTFIVSASGAIRKGELNLVSTQNTVINQPAPTVVQNTPQKQVTQGCNGCLVDKTCVEEGKIILNKYCEGKNLIEQKKDNENCVRNIECLSGTCTDGKCGKIGFIDSIISWFKGLFASIF